MARSRRQAYDGFSGMGAARPPRHSLRRWLWASVPVWSLGLLSCVPFVFHAASTRRLRDWLVSAGYLAVTVCAMALSIAGGSSTSNGSTDAVGTTAGGLLLLLMGAGSVHTALLYRGPTAPALTPGYGSTMADNATAIAIAQAAVMRRAEARRIVDTDPALARDLKIGRPDLQRDYDDGGLVDVNHVPAEILVRSLEWTWPEAQAVVTARDGVGGFTSSAELGAYTPVSPDRIDSVADLLLFRRS